MRLHRMNFLDLSATGTIYLHRQPLAVSYLDIGWLLESRRDADQVKIRHFRGYGGDEL